MVKIWVTVQLLVAHETATVNVAALQVSARTTALEMLATVGKTVGLQPKLVLIGTLLKLKLAVVHELVT